MGMKSVLAIAIVGAVGAAAGLPYYNGMQAEKYLDDAMTRYTTPGGLTFSKVDYQRGWRDASATSKVSFTNPEIGFEVELKHHIEHGPTLDALDLFTITTQPVLNDELAEKVGHYFGDQNPLTVVTRVAADGSERNTLTSPAFTSSALNKPELTIESQGVNGTLDYDAGKRHAMADITAPGLKLFDNQVEMVMGAITINANMERQREKVWTGDSKVAMQSLEIKPRVPSEPNFRLDNLRATSQQRAESEKLHTVRVAIEADSFSVADFTLANPGYAVEIKHLDIDAWTALNEKIAEIQSTSPDPRLAGQMIGIAFVSSLPQILRSNPELSITRLGAETPEGPINSTLRIAYKGNGQLQLDQPVAMLMDLEGDFEFTIPQNLMRQLLLDTGKRKLTEMAAAQGQEVAPEELEAMAQQTAETQLNLFLQQQWLVADASSYQTKLNYNRGQLTINGQSANQLFSMMLQPQAPQQ